MLCEILEMRDSSGGHSHRGDDIQEIVEWVTGCFFPPFATVTLDVLGLIGCAQTVFARGTFKASFLSTYLLFDVANFQAFRLSNVTDVYKILATSSRHSYVFPITSPFKSHGLFSQQRLWVAGGETDNRRYSASSGLRRIALVVTSLHSTSGTISE